MENHFTISEMLPNITTIDRINIEKSIKYTNKILFWWRILNEIREEYNEPITITSTYRNKEHNKKVGGSETSQHLTLDAIDFTIYKYKSWNDVINADKLFINLCKATIRVTNKRIGQIGQIIFYPYKAQIHIGKNNRRGRELLYGNTKGKIIPLWETDFWKKVKDIEVID